MNKLLCYLIDDDQDDIDFLSSALKYIDQSIKLLSFDNCKEAIQSLISDIVHIPDYIFLDLNMPCVSGLECIGHIRQIPHIANVPIIIFSTSSTFKDINEAQHLGAKHFFVKTPNFNFLIERLCDLFHNRLPKFLISQLSSN